MTAKWIIVIPNGKRLSSRLAKIFDMYPELFEVREADDRIHGKEPRGLIVDDVVIPDPPKRRNDRPYLKIKKGRA